MISSADYLRWLAVIWTVAIFVMFRREIGAWLNARAVRKSLRLLNAVSYWAAEPGLCE